MIDPKQIAPYLDLAKHSQEATWEDIQSICQDVLKYGFNSAFVNPYFVGDAKRLMGSQGKVGTVVAFPLGQELLEIKLASVRFAIEAGADELDVSLNVGLFKSGKYEESLDEARTIVEVAKAKNPQIIVKLITETGCLTEEEIKRSSEVVLASGADFLKTCSGMGPRGASLRDIELIHEAVGDKIKIKVAGGVGNLQQALEFIEKGAVRIGTSKAVGILEEALNETH